MKGVRQHDSRDCGVACIATICKHYGLNLPLLYIRNLAFLDKNGLNLYGIIKVAENLGFIAEALNGTYEELEEEIEAGKLQYPFIAHIESNIGTSHYVVVEKCVGKHIKVFDC